MEIKSPIKIWEEWRYKRLVKRVREDMMFLGFPVDGMDDEELVDRICKMSKILAKTGYTVKEVEDAWNVNAQIKIKEIKERGE